MKAKVTTELGEVELTFPSIHTNGTSAAELAENYGAAMTKVREAMEALFKCAPHGRDYYPLPQGALEDAKREAQNRLTRLQSILDELLPLAMHCSDHWKTL